MDSSLTKIGNKMKNAIIFGITGQDGSHLADLLLEKHYRVIGVSRRCSTDNTQRIKHILNNKNFELIEGDVTDYSSILNVLSSYESVDEVYNLAAQSHVGTSFQQPALTWDVTGKGCMNILQSIVDLNRYDIRFYQASSSEMFGSSYDTNEYGDKYQNEETKFMPNSPYAISKCSAHYSVRLYRDAYNLHASCGILFNHEGPRRGSNFVTKKITNWISEYKKWLTDNDFKTQHLCYSDDTIYGLEDKTFPKLKLGNINTYRDWGYAPDFVEAMWLMLQQDYADDYVICTGVTNTVSEFLDIAFNYANLPEWKHLVYIDPQLYRPSEVDYLRGDSSKARTKLGWKPTHSLEQLIKIMLDENL
jgi:GDPmannose 4,6-dehydratase